MVGTFCEQFWFQEMEEMPVCTTARQHGLITELSWYQCSLSYQCSMLPPPAAAIRGTVRE